MNLADLLVFLVANAPVVIAVTLFLTAGGPTDHGSRGIVALIALPRPEPRAC